MTSKNDPWRTPATAADPLRDEDIYGTASDTDQWCAQQLRALLAVVQRNVLKARADGDFARAMSWRRTAGTLAAAVSDMENAQMPRSLREAALKLGELPDDDLAREDWDVGVRDTDGMSAARLAEQAMLHAGGPDTPGGWDDNGAPGK
jgi:hypothetical protein